MSIEEAVVIYDLDDEATWGYSYAALRDQEGTYWFNQEQVEQYAMDWDEVDGVDFGVCLDRTDGGVLERAGYWRSGDSEVPVVVLGWWPVRVIDGHTYWDIPEMWRPVVDADFTREDF
jgi:hypothetical protein